MAGASAVEEGPLRAEMRAILEGAKPFPDSSARRHHFVPSFALAQFARPASRKGFLCQLDLTSGKPQKTRPHDVAFGVDLYAYENREGALSNRVEAFFAIVEKHAAMAFVRLRDDPGGLTPGEREAIAYFLVFQESRTPAGLAQRERLRQVVMEIQASADLASSGGFRQMYEEAAGGAKSAHELEQLRQRMQRQLLGGHVGYTEPKSGALYQIIQGAHELAEMIYALDWTILTAQEAEFITSDRPVSMVDHSPRYPWSGNAWMSSPGAVSFYPLSPYRGLFMTPGNCGLGLARSEARQVRRLNLMTYGWAERYIFGTTQDVVARVRIQARAHPSEVVKRRSNKQVLLVPAELHDRSVATEYARRGWPTGFAVRDEDGQMRRMSYVVIDIDGRAGKAARAALRSTEGLVHHEGGAQGVLSGRERSQVV